MRASLFVACLLGTALPLMAITTATNGDWHTGSTWVGGIAPGAGDDAVVQHSVTLNSAAAGLNSVTVDSGGALTFAGWTTVLGAITVEVNGTVTHAANTDTVGGDGWTPNARVYIQCTDLTVYAGGSISGDSLGYSGALLGSQTGSGPGAGYGQAGGGYGGTGGIGNYTPKVGGAPYGSATAPTDPGSGGGVHNTVQTGRRGGGAIRIDAGGAVVVDGVVSANGQVYSGQSSAGSGGSVYITCDTFDGFGGIVRANGGNGGTTNYSGAGGGGGRVAIDYNTTSQAVLNGGGLPEVTISANQGSARVDVDGYPGTISLNDASFYPSAAIEGGEFIIPGFTSWTVPDLTISTGLAVFPSGFQLTVTNDLVINGTSGGIELVNAMLDVQGNLSISTGAAGASYLYEGATSSYQVGGTLSIVTGRLIYQDSSAASSDLTVGGNVDVSGGAAFFLTSGPVRGGGDDFGTRLIVTGDLNVASGSSLYPKSNAADGGSVLMQVANLAIASGGQINADSRGYAGAQSSYSEFASGPGGSQDTHGGSFGGLGGNGYYGGTTGPTYGSVTDPVTPGSGGGWHGSAGGAGGGMVWIEASASMLVEGTIAARGQGPVGQAGAGSGGAIYLTTDTFAGAGTLTADGGNASTSHFSHGGAGGGGRIAVWRNTDSFSGAATAGGGGGYAGHEGADGTVFFGWINGNPTALCQDATVCANRTIDPSLVDAGSYDVDYNPVSLALSPASPYSVGTQVVTLIVTDTLSRTDSCTATLTVLDASSPKIWNGTGDWHADFGNWVPCPPEAGDDAIIQSGTVTLTASTAALASLTVDAGTTLLFDSFTAVASAATVDVNGTVSHTANTDTNGGDGWQPNARVNIACTDLTVYAGGSINGDYLGYRGALLGSQTGNGPGAGYGQAGGGYGGDGGIGDYSPKVGGAPYGSAAAPTDPGSGAGVHNTSQTGRHGGGAIRIDASGAVVVDGTISANGQTYSGQSSAGSGGGIYISCDTFDGSGGVVRADGGNGGAGNYSGAGGGGGRIAIDYNTVSQAVLNGGGLPEVLISANQGTARVGAEAYPGTIWISDSSFFPNAATLQGGELQVQGFTSWTVADLTVTTGLAVFPSGFQLTVTNDLTTAGTGGGIEMANGTLDVQGNLSINTGVSGASYLYEGASSSYQVGGTLSVATGRLFYADSTAASSDVVIGGDLTLTSGGKVYLTSGPLRPSEDYGTLVSIGGDLSVDGTSVLYPKSNGADGGSVLFQVSNLTVAAGGQINANARGFAGAAASYTEFGDGPGGSQDTHGGSYGGLGGPGHYGGTTGPTYGSEQNPVDPGSGGGWHGRAGGAGGGVVRIEASGDTTLDGTISAEGQGPVGQAGAGAGGSIYLITGGFAGGGSLSADGGDGSTAHFSHGGAGGGGRVAVWRSSHTFTGSATAAGGTAYAGHEGSVGTVFFGITNYPPDAVCQNYTVALGPTGSVTITGANVDGGSSDPDDDELTLTVSPNTFTCAELGDNTVTLTVDDGTVTDDCTATVTVTSAGSCADLQSAAEDAVCAAGQAFSSEEQIVAFINAQVTIALGGSTICDTVTVSECLAALFSALGL